MAISPHRFPPIRAPRTSRSAVLGVVFSFVLFLVMALAQLIGQVEPPKTEVDETLLAYVPPEIEVLEDEEPPPPEEEEPPPEQLEEEPPQLSLDQLDIALNPGTGGALSGDFAMPTIATSSADLGTDDFVDFSDLDQKPRPIGATGFNFPARLKRKAVSGRIVLFLQLNERGDVVTVKVDSSTLPAFDSFVVGEVRGWRFTPPSKNGKPVKAQALFPIPITIN